jgi:hypothetical protein
VDERRGVDGRQAVGDRDHRRDGGHGALGACARLPEPGDDAASHPPGVRSAARREHPPRDAAARHVRRAQVEEVGGLARAQGASSVRTSATSTAISASPGPATGSGASAASRTPGPPNRTTWIVFMTR